MITIIFILLVTGAVMYFRFSADRKERIRFLATMIVCLAGVTTAACGSGSGRSEQQQKQQAPEANGLTGKSIESPEVEALKLTLIYTCGIGGTENKGCKCATVWGYSKTGRCDETARYFLVNCDKIILDELIWEKKAGIMFDRLEVFDSAVQEKRLYDGVEYEMDALKECYIRYKIVEDEWIVLSIYECDGGKFIEKKPAETMYVGSD